MNSILIPESLLHEKTYNADKYFNERFPSDYATMEANPNYSESGCGIAVTASDTENTLSIKDPADSSKELCKLTYSNGKLKFTYKKPAMVNNITMVGVGSTEKLNILENNFDILHLNVVKKLGGAHVPSTSIGILILNSVCYGNGKFVAVAMNNSNTFAYSTDGINWTEGTMPSSHDWDSVCYGNGKFVAVAMNNSNTFAYSTDGINWTKGTMPSIQTWGSVCYGNGKFVAVAEQSNVFAYSTDGINWTQGTMPSSHRWTSVCYGNGKFVAGSLSSNVFAYSTDGITWTEGTMPSSQDWQSVCYGNGKFVAIARSTNVFAYSTDGITWTAGSMSDTSDWMSVCYGNGKFVAVAYQDSSIMFAYSHNGYQWYTVTMDPSFYVDGVYNYYRSVCYSPDHNFFVTVSSPVIISIPDAYAGGICNTFAVEYSWSGTIPSGVTLPNPTSYASGATVTVDTKYTSDSIVQESGEWTQGTMPSSHRWTSVCYGNGKYVATTSSLTTSGTSNVFAYSTDGITWTQGIMPSSQDWGSVCYGNGKFVAVCSASNNIFAYSTDGINWSQGTMPSSNKWYSICYGNGKFVAVAEQSNVFAYSTDGITWTKGTMPSSQYWSSVCYGNDKFVAVTWSTSSSNAFAYSTDGINWTQGTMPSIQTWGSVCYGNGKFVAVCDQSIVFAYSTDGINWTQGTMPNSNGWSSVCYGTGMFVAVYSGSNIFAYSTDGITWTKGRTPNNGGSICYGNDKFVAIRNGSNSSTFIYLTPPSTYYQFSGWNKSGTFNITSDTSITGRWTHKSKLSVTYSWTNAPTGMTSTVPAKVTGLMPNETVTVDSKYTNKSAYKDESAKKYYKFSGWNKSGEFNITSNTNISGSWDNGTSAPSMGGDFSSLTVGSTFMLGKYQVESEDPWDIEWEIVHQTNDYQVAMTKQIIDLRPFDGKESTNPDSDRKSYGNNNWQYSNIKQFLNSDQANWYSAQHQYDAPPSKDNCYHYSNGTTYNAYDNHKGFLYYWTADEKALLRDMTLTLANNTVTDGGGSYTWTGKVWLPTYTQMGGGQNNGISEGEAFSKFTDDASKIKSLHPNCAANNEYCKVNNYASGSNLWYCMSSALPSYSNRVRYVNSGGSIGRNCGAYDSSCGFAPCICLPRTGSFGTPGSFGFPSDLNYVD